jgi:hypothetical protein
LMRVIVRMTRTPRSLKLRCIRIGYVSNVVTKRYEPGVLRPWLYHLAHLAETPSVQRQSIREPRPTHLRQAGNQPAGAKGAEKPRPLNSAINVRRRFRAKETNSTSHRASSSPTRGAEITKTVVQRRARAASPSTSALAPSHWTKGVTLGFAPVCRSWRPSTLLRQQLRQRLELRFDSFDTVRENQNPSKPPLRHPTSTLRHPSTSHFPHFDMPAASLKKRGSRRVRVECVAFLLSTSGLALSDAARFSRRSSVR